jgi:hypothetical protein
LLDLPHRVLEEAEIGAAQGRVAGGPDAAGEAEHRGQTCGDRERL